MALIKPKGRRTWYWVYQENCRKIWVSLKTTNKDEAQIRMGERMRQRHRPHFGVPVDPEDISWSDMVKKFLSEGRGNGNCENTVNRKRACLEHVNQLALVNNLSEWTGAKLEEFKRLRLQEGASPPTINKELVLIKAVLRRAKRHGYIAPTLEDITEVKRIKHTPSRPISYTTQELGIIATEANNYWRMAILLIALQGLRRSELLNLRWQDVNFEQEELTTVDREDARTKMRRTEKLPLHAAVAAALLEWREINPKESLVLPWQSRPEVFSKTFKRILKHAGFKSGCLKSLRASFASNLERAGVSAWKIQALMRHRPRGVTATHYIDIRPAELREGINLLQNPLNPDKNEGQKPSNGSSNAFINNRQQSTTSSNMQAFS